MIYELPYDLDALVSSEDAFSAAPPVFMGGKRGRKEGDREGGREGWIGGGKGRSKARCSSSFFLHPCIYEHRQWLPSSCGHSVQGPLVRRSA
jgi:hypothetical protein